MVPVTNIRYDPGLRGARGAEGSGPPLSCKFLVRCDRDRSIFGFFIRYRSILFVSVTTFLGSFLRPFFREFFDDQRIFLTTRGDSWVAFGLKNDFSGG